MIKKDNENNEATKSESDKIMLLALSKRRFKAYKMDIPSGWFIILILFFGFTPTIKKYFELIVLVVIPFLCIFRDVFGRSFGKYICRLKIVSTEGDEKPTLKQLILRNIIYLPYPDLVTVPRDGIRFGDKIAKTKVVFEDDDWENHKDRW